MPRRKLSRRNSVTLSFLVRIGFTVQARLVYLWGNLFLMLTSILYGFWTWEATQNLTIKVDLLSLSCTIMAVIINIVVESVKSRVNTTRTVIILDIVGSILSLGLLLIVGLMGLLDAWEAYQLYSDGQAVETFHLSKLSRYGMFAFTLSLANLTIFGGLSNLMLPKEGSVHDQLNILSNLAHSIIDLVSNAAVLSTALWLSSNHETATNWDFEQQARKKTMIDIVGSLVICLCIIVSIGILSQDIVHAVHLVKLEDQKAADDTASEYTESEYSPSAASSSPRRARSPSHPLTFGTSGSDAAQPNPAMGERKPSAPSLRDY